MAQSKMIPIPTDERLRSLLVRLQKNDDLFGKTSESSLDILFSLEAYYEETGNETEVLKTCRKILTRNEARAVPDDAISCEFLVREAYALMTLEQYAEAEKSAREALPLTRMIAGPDSYPYYLNNRLLVDAMERNGKPLSAMHRGKTLLRLASSVLEENSSEYTQVFLDQARRFIRTGKQEDALRTLDRIDSDSLKEKEMRIQHLMLKLIVYGSLERYKEVLQTGRKVLPLLDPQKNATQYDYVEQCMNTAGLMLTYTDGKPEH